MEIGTFRMDWSVGHWTSLLDIGTFIMDYSVGHWTSL